MQRKKQIKLATSTQLRRTEQETVAATQQHADKALAGCDDVEIHTSRFIDGKVGQCQPGSALEHHSDK